MRPIKENLPAFLFAIGIAVLLIPVFSMGYLFSLDGPAHFYNALIFNNLIFGGDDDFYAQFITFNSEFTPNWLGLFWVGLLLKIFTPLVAFKVFNASFILLFSGAIYYFLKGIIKESKIPFSILLIFPFISSFFIIAGFINFYISFILLFFTLGFYVRIQKFNWKNLLLLTLLILVTYLGHSIVFGFLLLLIGVFEFTKHILVSYNLKLFIKAAFRSLLIAAPPILLTLLFLGARKSEISYLSFSDLSYNLITMKSLMLFDAQSIILNTFFALLLLLSAIGIGIHRYKSTIAIKQTDFLLAASTFFLLLYYIVPDSVGFASVFSVRISYFFWLTLVCWLIIEISEFKHISIGFALFSFIFIFILWNTAIQKTEYVKLNNAGKEVIKATEYIESESIVHPVFASNVWNHLHFSNLLGLQKPLLILENTCTRQDYFPILYLNPYEKCLQEAQTLSFICNSQQIDIDYLFMLGDGSVDNPMDQKLIDEAITGGAEIVYQTDFIKIYKVR